ATTTSPSDLSLLHSLIPPQKERRGGFHAGHEVHSAAAAPHPARCPRGRRGGLHAVPGGWLHAAVAERPHARQLRAGAEGRIPDGRPGPAGRAHPAAARDSGAGEDRGRGGDEAMKGSLEITDEQIDMLNDLSACDGAFSEWENGFI